MAPGILLHEIPEVYSPTKEFSSGTAAFRVNNWPGYVGTSLAWDSKSCPTEEDFNYELSLQDNREIDSALAHFHSLGLDGNEADCDTFPLPALGATLRQRAVDLHQGIGFFNIRGLDPARYSPEDNVIVYLGISSYVGSKRAKQDEDGNMLMHIRDARQSSACQKDRPTRFSRRASTFHTDTFCDILALQTRSRAAQGGRHLLASSYTIYNKILKQRPDLVDVLSRPNWPFDSRGRLFDCNKRALLYYYGGHLILNFAREPLIGLDNIARTPGLPELSTEQREALDLVEAVARESQIVLDLQPGDLTFINNHAILHSREAFEDDAASSRYLVRMWLKNPSLAWKLPAPLREGNSRIFDKNELPERWNIIPIPQLRFKLSERLCS